MSSIVSMPGLLVEQRMQQIDRPVALQQLGEPKGIEAPAAEIAMAQEERRALAGLHLGHHLVAWRPPRPPACRTAWRMVSWARMSDGRDAMARRLLELEQHLGGLQRIAADLEEVVVDADVRRASAAAARSRRSGSPAARPAIVWPAWLGEERRKAGAARSCRSAPTGRLSTTWTCRGIWNGASRS